MAGGISIHNDRSCGTQASLQVAGTKLWRVWEASSANRTEEFREAVSERCSKEDCYEQAWSWAKGGLVFETNLSQGETLLYRNFLLHATTVTEHNAYALQARLVYREGGRDASHLMDGDLLPKNCVTNTHRASHIHDGTTIVPSEL